MTSDGAVRTIQAPGRDTIGETPEAFLAWLGGPAVLRIPGRDRTRARGLSTLLHGNEPSGLRALFAWLREGAVPAVDLVCAIGAVEAAREPPGFAHRMLPGRSDLNRCFGPPDGVPPGSEPERRLAAALLHALREARCEALVDLHNNTGHNPPYGVATRLDVARLNLTALFAERIVHNAMRLGTLVEATADDFPSMTIECGRAGDPAADRVARAGFERYAELDVLETRELHAPHMAVLEKPLRVRARPEVRLAFGDRPVAGADLTLAADVDRHNFELLGPGVTVGWVGTEGSWPIEARGADGVDVSRKWFALRDGRLETRRTGVPIMMTTDPIIARADCLFYLARPGESSLAERVEGAGGR
jgi:hypothetical protein